MSESYKSDNLSTLDTCGQITIYPNCESPGSPEFSEKDWLSTLKLPILQGTYSNFSLIMFNYFLNLR